MVIFFTIVVWCSVFLSCFNFFLRISYVIGLSLLLKWHSYCCIMFLGFRVHKSCVAICQRAKLSLVCALFRSLLRSMFYLQQLTCVACWNGSLTLNVFVDQIFTKLDNNFMFMLWRWNAIVDLNPSLQLHGRRLSHQRR